MAAMTTGAWHSGRPAGITTHRILTADGRFRSEADKFKGRPWPSRSRMTRMRDAAAT